jgi:hypothetical protein
VTEDEDCLDATPIVVGTSLLSALPDVVRWDYVFVKAIILPVALFLFLLLYFPLLPSGGMELFVFLNLELPIVICGYSMG